MRRVGLYIHWPFCQAKCPYCDFNSHVVAAVDQAAWRSAYTTEIKRYKDEVPDAVVGSIFFGGGTPSLMEPETVASIIDDAQRAWRFANDVEITLEANPTSVEAERFRGYRMAGVNRVSMGIQALDDDDLRRLGRLHSVSEARAAFDIARQTFDRISFDLIYARQGQTAAAWETELAEALRMAADHLSLYQLSVEDGTAFGDRHARGKLKGLPDEDLAATLYEITQNMTESAGLPAYEISNHARPGAESQHNLTYWRGGEYIGIGPGAHGRVHNPNGWIATEAETQPMRWLAAVQAGTVEQRSLLSALDRAEERAMMGLRVGEGVDRSDLAPFETRLPHLEDLGVIRTSNDKVQLTESGRPVLNAILRDLLA
ncbi:radical SAM family heme chaperone HemW [Palleronia abyssalis]|uniref:radical SAM family heme chaperone HemW n=1 Tax=Palleronia abyssalis TaxID=1501240 RepID=UPI000D55565B|nr:radical SAM family heme chaperone HemW [Palleronia abyssalis]